VLHQVARDRRVLALCAAGASSVGTVAQADRELVLETLRDDRLEAERGEGDSERVDHVTGVARGELTADFPAGVLERAQAAGPRWERPCEPAVEVLVGAASPNTYTT